MECHKFFSRGRVIFMGSISREKYASVEWIPVMGCGVRTMSRIMLIWMTTPLKFNMQIPEIAIVQRRYPSSHSHASVNNGRFSKIVVSFHLRGSFPLNHDYGRKGNIPLKNRPPTPNRNIWARTWPFQWITGVKQPLSVGHEPLLIPLVLNSHLLQPFAHHDQHRPEF